MPKRKNRTDLSAHFHALNISAVSHFDAAYGKNESKVESWQQLCRDIGVQEGFSVTQCKKHLKGNFVNIHDFVEAQKSKQQVRIFRSAKALAEYTKTNKNKILPLHMAKENPILKWMLIHIR